MHPQERSLDMVAGVLGDMLTRCSSRMEKEMERQSDAGVDRKKIMILTEKEQEVIRMMRMKQDGSLTIRYRNGGIEQVDVEESLDVDRKIGDIIRDSDHQDITVKIAHGKVVRITRVNRKRFVPTHMSVIRLTSKSSQ